MRPTFLISLCVWFDVAAVAVFSLPAPQTPEAPPSIKLVPRVRPANTVRLGGVYTLDLGTDKLSFTNAAAHGIRLSPANAKWVGSHCDLIAVDPITVAPGTFRKLTQAQPLFTPLLFLYASYLSERPSYRAA